MQLYGAERMYDVHSMCTAIRTYARANNNEQYGMHAFPCAYMHMHMHNDDEKKTTRQNKHKPFLV